MYRCSVQRPSEWNIVDGVWDSPKYLYVLLDAVETSVDLLFLFRKLFSPPIKQTETVNKNICSRNREFVTQQADCIIIRNDAIYSLR